MGRGGTAAPGRELLLVVTHTTILAAADTLEGITITVDPRLLYITSFFSY